jgi:hypothetical protein
MIFWNYLRGITRAPNLPSRMLHHAGDTATCGTFEPATSGPTAIVIGARAPRKALASLAKRHGLEVSALEAFARQEVAA